MAGGLVPSVLLAAMPGKKKWDKTSVMQIVLMLMGLFLLASVMQFSEFSQHYKELDHVDQNKVRLEEKRAHKLMTESEEMKKHADEESQDSHKQMEASERKRKEAQELIAVAEADMNKAKKAKAEEAAKEHEAREESESADDLQHAAEALGAAAATYEAGAREAEGSAAKYSQEALETEGEEAADGATVAALEWVPFADVVADVVGAATEDGLAAKAAEDQAAAAEESVKAYNKEELSQEESTRSRAKAEEAERARGRARQYKEKALTLGTVSSGASAASIAARSSAHRDIAEAKRMSSLAARKVEASEKLSRQAKHSEVLGLSQQEEAVKELKKQEDALRKARALAHGARYTMTFASFQAVVLMVLSWPLAQTGGDLACRLGIQTALIRDPRDSGKWSKQMGLLERAVFLAFLYSSCALLKVCTVQMDGLWNVWILFLVLFFGILAFSLVMAACTRQWARADLDRTRNCGCLDERATEEMVSKDMRAALFWSGNNACIVLILGISCYAHLPATWRAMKSNASPVVSLVLGMSCAILRWVLGIIRCGCACAAPPAAPCEEPWLWSLVPRIGSWRVFLLAASLVVFDFVSWWPHLKDLPELWQDALESLPGGWASNALLCLLPLFVASDVIIFLYVLLSKSRTQMIRHVWSVARSYV